MYWDKDGQGYLFAPSPGTPKDTKAWKKFRKYDCENPQIWERFVQITKQAWDRGFRKIGAHYIIQIMRWDTGLRARDEYKIGNNYFPYYARKFMLEYPEYQGMFELRALKGD